MYFGAGADGEGVVGVRGFLPGECVFAAEVEEFESASGAVSGGDVAAWWGLVSGVGDGLSGDLGGGMGDIHVGEFGGDDEAVVAYEGFSCCADTLLAVGC